MGVSEVSITLLRGKILWGGGKPQCSPFLTTSDQYYSEMLFEPGVNGHPLSVYCTIQLAQS